MRKDQEHETAMYDQPELDFGDDIKPAPYEPTPAQVTMRHDMENVNSLNAVLDEVMGKQPDDLFGKQVQAIAIHLISQSKDLSLSLQQWAVVQSLIEQGIKTGWQRGRDSRR